MGDVRTDFCIPSCQSKFAFVLKKNVVAIESVKSVVPRVTFGFPNRKIAIDPVFHPFAKKL